MRIVSSKNIKLASNAIIIILILAAVLPCTAQIPLTPVVAPINPKFLDYLRSVGMLVYQAQTEAGPPSGLIPETILLPQAAVQAYSLKSAITYPAYFDLRTKNKLTSVKNQSSCGSCWAFAAYGSLESCLTPSEIWDYSENNMKNTHGLDLSCCAGGNRVFVMAYLARWSGPINETDDPYNAGNCTSASGFSVKKHIQNAIFIPDRRSSLDNDGIKQAVISYGAIYSTYYHNNTYYKSSNRAYYYNGGTASNHAICIVGWDDNFDRNNFATIPPGNGAFIIKNSWGSGWGESGYYYISYYDTHIGCENMAFIQVGQTNNYNVIYQYDTLGWTQSIGYSTTTAWGANVFVATSSDDLQAASWYTASQNSTYELRIYKNVTSSPINAAGPVITQTGVIKSPGYFTIQLNNPIPISNGQKFSVVLKLTTPGYNYPIPIETPFGSYSSNARANANESYISYNGSSWSDITGYYANTNICLKAFAGPTNYAINAIKKLADGTTTTVRGKIISAVFNDCIYISESNRSSGIRVATSSTGLQIGDVVTVTGTMASYKPDNVNTTERQIIAESITID